jgi:hypothetical protein
VVKLLPYMRLVWMMLALLLMLVIAGAPDLIPAVTPL